MRGERWIEGGGKGEVGGKREGSGQVEDERKRNDCEGGRGGSGRR